MAYVALNPIKMPPVGSIVKIYTRPRYRWVRITKIFHYTTYSAAWGVACSKTGLEYKSQLYFEDHQIREVILHYDPLVQFAMDGKVKPIGTKASIKRD